MNDNDDQQIENKPKCKSQTELFPSQILWCNKYGKAQN